MSVVVILLPLALLLGLGFVGAYLWAVRSGQFAEGETPAMRVLIDESRPEFAPDPDRPAPSDRPTRT